MVEVNFSFARGDRIKVVYEAREYKPGGREEVNTKEDIGEIVAKPSRKFTWENDDFDFDYELNRGNAVRSVDLDSEIVAQLSYDAGGDRDWLQWKLLEVSRID